MKRKICALLLVLAMLCVITAYGQNVDTPDDITASVETSTENKASDQVSSPIEELPEIGVSFWTYLCGNIHTDDAPVSIVVGIDQGGYLREANYDSTEDIEYALSLLANVVIGAETNEVYTDNYNYLTVYWPDDTYTTVNLNLTNLEIFEANTPHYYKLENFDEFWKNSKSIAVDAE